MRKANRINGLRQDGFNTLALLQTGGIEKPTTIIQGQGSQPMTKESCQMRGKRKQVTQALAIKLVIVAQQKRNKKLVKQFRNSYYCQNGITTHNGKIHGKYCKTRFCTICSSNRKANLINKLAPVIEKWEDSQMVTLTVANCKAQYLKRKINKMYAVFKSITEKHYKRYQRGKGFKLVGIRSLECTFNPLRRDYHPHFHMIVPNLQIANTITQDWLKAWGVHEASGAGQHKRPANDIQHDLIETIKYCAKIFTEPDPKNKTKQKGNRTIYVRALYNMINSMCGVHLFEKFGFEYPKQKEDTLPARVVTDFQNWLYVREHLDWICTETGNPLTAYIASDELTDILKNGMDMQLE
jgi:hypothetical protein